jgi:Co/Zn/Cd efflux system component
MFGLLKNSSPSKSSYSTQVARIAAKHLGLSKGLYALSAHAMLSEGASHATVPEALRECLASTFKIGHITVQVEPNCDDEGVHG